ncbi:cupin domain-containing protein [Crocosphaera sp.]|uniref:cupin domain-containing protein n=1 Tax=Crocosphaera sp. TaxID=2729996 RepID=UPI002629F5BB|nr:cupin domain-containing protein [Crocosphaera sp.]MDJ0580431.1 cupin domain-containing protein [Crocosphaera sp.]
MNNIFQFTNQLSEQEIFETILNSKNVKIERIISTGQTTAEDTWYDQEEDEWVILLQGQATLLFFDNSSIHLKAGDYLLIKAHQKHRVTYTSFNPPCIWLAIHGNL